MTPTAPEELSLLISSQIASLSLPPSDDQLRALSHIVGASTLLAAFDLLDHNEVARISTPSGRPVYQVSGSDRAYTVHPSINAQGDGYCPCPAFSYSVIYAGTSVICKHLLAVRLADKLGLFVDKEMGLKWLEALATRFTAVS